MGTARFEDAPIVVDHYEKKPTFCTKLVRVDRLPGDLFLFVYGVHDTDGDGNPIITIVDKQIWPLCFLPAAVHLASRKIAEPDAPLLFELDVVVPVN